MNRPPSSFFQIWEGACPEVNIKARQQVILDEHCIFRLVQTSRVVLVVVRPQLGTGLFLFTCFISLFAKVYSICFIDSNFPAFTGSVCLI
jgi:hypothetical protein